MALDHCKDRLVFVSFVIGSNEFIDREDGWPGLRWHYDLPQIKVRGLDHDLACRALDSGKIDIADLYSTYVEIRYYDLVVLDDDADFFPEYRAVFLYRAELEQHSPAVVKTLHTLEGLIPQNTMVAMNARTNMDRVPEDRVAADFLHDTLKVEI